jgi:hypothetical protein
LRTLSLLQLDLVTRPVGIAASTSRRAEHLQDRRERAVGLISERLIADRVLGDGDFGDVLEAVREAASASRRARRREAREAFSARFRTAWYIQPVRLSGTAGWRINCRTAS